MRSMVWFLTQNPNTLLSVPIHLKKNKIKKLTIQSYTSTNRRFYFIFKSIETVEVWLASKTVDKLRLFKGVSRV